MCVCVCHLRGVCWALLRGDAEVAGQAGLEFTDEIWVGDVTVGVKSI